MWKQHGGSGSQSEKPAESINNQKEEGASSKMLQNVAER